MKIIDKMIDRLADRVAENIESRNTISVDSIKAMDLKDSEKILNYRLGEKTDRFEGIIKNHDIAHEHDEEIIGLGTLDTNPINTKEGP